jgi:hypothetical protein
MNALLKTVLPVLLIAGCIGGDFNAPDMGASTGPDMATPHIFDLAGVDLFGLYNCTGLNKCEQACTTPACDFMCQNMATPNAKALDTALQSCFTMFCPTGAGQVCDGSSGMVSAVCMMCIANTYIPSGMSCQATQQTSECHQCEQEADACTADM